MATKKQVEKVPYISLKDIHIQNTAASFPEGCVSALIEVAKAATANAEAIHAIADALRGVPANMTHGINLTGPM